MLPQSWHKKIESSARFDDITNEFVGFLTSRLDDNSKTPDAIKEELARVGRQLLSQSPTAFPLLNLCQRMINLIKNPNARMSSKTKQISNIVSEFRSETDLSDRNASLPRAISDDVIDFETSFEELTSIAASHINSGETVLVYSTSSLVDSFIEEAKGKSGVNLILIKNTLKDNFPEKAAKDAANILVVSDSAVYSIMHRVNKIFVDAHAIMADGSIVTDAGLFPLCLMAREFSVPVVVLAPLYKFTPLFAFNCEVYNERLRPPSLASDCCGVKGIEVLIFKYDHIPPELVSLIITQTKEVSPTLVHRLFFDYYGNLDQGYKFT